MHELLCAVLPEAKHSAPKQFPEAARETSAQPSECRRHCSNAPAQALDGITAV